MALQRGRQYVPRHYRTPARTVPANWNDKSEKNQGALFMKKKMILAGIIGMSAAAARIVTACDNGADIGYH
ncbi:MAG: hypothetical protein LBH57_07375 [Treponema sp.]|jgi:hypothetical protein|nr:hypothetical protein [Treponema sp.]